VTKSDTDVLKELIRKHGYAGLERNRRKKGKENSNKFFFFGGIKQEK